MPYSWSSDPQSAPLSRHDGTGAAPLALHLTAHNSLTPQGFVWFIGITSVLMCVPLMAFFGSVFWWGILGYLGLTLGAAWFALQRSWKRGSVHEHLEAWGDHLRLTRTNPNGQILDWEANPYWVRVVTHAADGPVPHYVTLCGAGRDVEIGAFLSEDERKALANELTTLLNRLRQSASPA